MGTRKVPSGYDKLKERHRRRALRRAAVDALGNKCIRCGWTGHVVGFDIHHPHADGGEQRKKMHERSIMRDVIENPGSYELLCAICHRLEHAEGLLD